MEEIKGYKRLILIDIRTTTAVLLVVLILSLISMNIVDRAIDNSYESGYEAGNREVMNFMNQSAAPVCGIVTVSDETLDTALRYIDVNCLTED